MYRSNKVYLRLGLQFSEVINDNHELLLLMDFFNIEKPVGDKTIEEVCNENNVNLDVFLLIGNLYNGFSPGKDEVIDNHLNVSSIISFLGKSHSYYRDDKYPEIASYIKELYKVQKHEDVKLIEEFFNTYFEEVLQHFNYEENTAFPYFCELISPEGDPSKFDYSSHSYQQRHTDIETKLTDLKNLLLKYINLPGSLSLKRKILHCLFELENDLMIHSVIEERVLIPIIEDLEKQK